MKIFHIGFIFLNRLHFLTQIFKSTHPSYLNFLFYIIAILFDFFEHTNNPSLILLFKICVMQLYYAAISYHVLLVPANRNRYRKMNSFS